MRALTIAEILNIWESGAASPPVERALLLLSAACDDLTHEQLARLSVGERDARLLTLREQIFGRQLDGLANCPACGERAAFQFTGADVQIAPDDRQTENLTVTHGDFQVIFRLPNSSDLAELSSQASVAANRLELVAGCLLSVRHLGEAISVGQLPEEVIVAIAERMSKADPQADIQLALTCPRCGHNWIALFDIAEFFWMELSALARRLLREVHTLASAYNWHEAEILALSPVRRQAYLEMVGT